MTRENFRLALVIILVVFLGCYYKDMSRPQYPKYLPFIYIGEGGVIDCDSGRIYTPKGIYDPTYYGLEFESKESLEKISLDPNDLKILKDIKIMEEKTNNPSQ